MAKRRAKNIHIGIGLILVSTLAFTIMSALIRSLGDRIPLGEIAFSRSLFALIPLLLMLQWQGELRDAFILKKPIRHLTRAIAGIGSMFCNFASLARLPLADMMVKASVEPRLRPMPTWMFFARRCAMRRFYGARSSRARAVPARESCSECVSRTSFGGGSAPPGACSPRNARRVPRASGRRCRTPA
jgi:hypothetical protein